MYRTSNCPLKGFIGMFYLSMMGEFSPFSLQLCTILSIMHSLEAVRVKREDRQSGRAHLFACKCVQCCPFFLLLLLCDGKLRSLSVQRTGAVSGRGEFVLSQALQFGNIRTASRRKCTLCHFAVSLSRFFIASLYGYAKVPRQ